MLRTVAVLLAALTLLLCLASCGGSQTPTGYTFKAPNGTELFIGALHDDVIPKLGNYQYMNSSAACGGFKGEDRIYYYNGFVVKTTPGKKGDFVNHIELTDDSVSTPQGITIGSTKDQVLAAMGQPTVMGDNLAYEKDNMKLMFLFRDGTVTNIQYILK